MASYKEFDTSDIANTKTMLYENIPITGSIVSGTYSENNIKKFSHGMFQSVYDYPYLSSSANQLFDITTGYSVSSQASSSAVVANNQTSSKTKINIYNQMAKVLAGVDSDGNILKLDEDGTFNNSGDLMHEAIFINFSRLLVKDEIKKGSFRLDLGVGTSSSEPFNAKLFITDSGSINNGFVGINSPVGEYSYLYADGLTSGTLNQNTKCGLIFYQAGVVALNTNVFALSSSNEITSNISSNKRGLLKFSSPPVLLNGSNISQLLASGSIDDVATALRNRIENITINNSTQLNSTIYFCRVPSSEFNYSSNPTYLNKSKIRVKVKKDDAPVSYFTTVGLYSANNELMAVAKLSEPIRKDPTVDLTLRVRLDF